VTLAENIDFKKTNKPTIKNHKSVSSDAPNINKINHTSIKLTDILAIEIINLKKLPIDLVVAI
jgi:hypothetical protein